MDSADDFWFALVFVVCLGLAAKDYFGRVGFSEWIGLLKTLILFLFSVLFLLSLGFFVYKRIHHDKNLKIADKAIPKKRKTIHQRVKYDSEKSNAPKRKDNLIPERQAERKSEAGVKPVVQIKVDEFKGCYKEDSINADEKKFLLNHGYSQAFMKSICSKKKGLYLIKPRFNETINHMFFVHDIAGFFVDRGYAVEKYITKKPDLVVNINGRQIAIEVETGTILDKNRKQLIEKVNLLNENYDEWFFVLTNRNYVKKYKEFGTALDTRYLKGYLNSLIRLNSH